MGSAGVPENEKERLQALYAYGILDTVEEESFDAICQLASALCNTPIALISLLDRQRQWFKAVVGLDVRETERECSICAHAVLDGEMLVIEDLASDERTCDNRLVLRGPRMRFYAGEPIRAFSGHILGTLCVIDQRPRSLAEDEKEALRVLARQVESQLEVRRLNGELAQSNAVRERLTQFVVHDLSSPVTTVALLAHQLAASPSAEEVADTAVELASAADAMHSMVSDLRDISVGKSGALAPRYQSLDVSRVVDSVAQGMQVRFREQGIELHLACSPLSVEGDAYLLGRLVQNLLSNACHYAESRVEVGCVQRNDGRIEIYVEDDGIGVPDEQKERVFDLYARAHTTPRDFARGIGLAFCKSVVDAHAGRIEVIDREPRGSRFRVLLPQRRP